MNAILGIVSILAASLILLGGAYELGREFGYRQGFDAGEKWLLKISEDVEAEREKMWGEELQR